MLDSYGREINYMRLSVTQLCNLRCRYCMPEKGICKRRHEEILTQEEMIRAVEAAAAVGVTKLRITGGEPLIKPNILSICREAASVDGIEKVCLTTNGILLPQYAAPLKDAGVKSVNISLDTLNGDKYKYITRTGTVETALKGIVSALDAGFEKVKINTVLIGKFNDDEIRELAHLTEIYPVDVRFIELMPMTDSADFKDDSFIPCAVVLEKLPELRRQEQDGGVARLYRLPGAMGNVGLISPLSVHFCSACNRIRLTADGKLKPCLHSPLEYSIKGMDFQNMKAAFTEAILAKPSCHDKLSAKNKSQAGRSMNQIGG